MAKKRKITDINIEEIRPNTAFDPSTFRLRWIKERARSPIARSVNPGETLTREFKGKVHKITCQYGYWEYEGQHFGTLMAAVTAITGHATYPAAKTRKETTLRHYSSFSLERFFGQGKKPPKKDDTLEEQSPKLALDDSRDDDDGSEQ